MKKFLIITFLFMTLTFLFSCQSLNNNNKENIFESHLSNYKDVYLERIAYFNELSQTHIASSVKIRTFGTKFTTGTGSGVIYKKTDTHYFVLTNQHVIADDLIEETVYEIYDYKGKTYKADLVVYDRNYDLAVLKFEVNDIDLKVATFASKNPAIGSFLSTIGNPHSQVNAITFGAALYYDDEIKIFEQLGLYLEFESLVTTIPLKSGNSGGPVFDIEFKVAALVYGSLGSVDSDSSSKLLMLAIPVSTILEFLELYEAFGVNI